MKNKIQILLLSLLIPFAVQAACTGNEDYGTYCRLFAVDSPWNVIPINPPLGTTIVTPKTKAQPTWAPTIASGAYSTGIFRAVATDPAVTVYPQDVTRGLGDPDNNGPVASVTIPRFPASTAPATGSDGHAEIVDESTGVVHSFWQLKKNSTTGKWTAELYSWAPMKGRGWGDPAHYYQGARATGVPSSGGVIRIHEVNDGHGMYDHALAMSLPVDGLSATKTYVYPATAADQGAATSNFGTVPEGARLMLPANFNMAQIKNVQLQKVVKTLMTYGALVVDRNYGTPYSIYVENGAPFNVYSAGAELEIIRQNLRMVSLTAAISYRVRNPASTEYYKGVPMGNWVNYGPKNVALNMLSMRGLKWAYQSTGSAASKAVFNTYQQGAVFPSSKELVTQAFGVNPSLTNVTWAQLVPGAAYRLNIAASSGAQMRVQIGVNGGTTLDSGFLGNGGYSNIIWPVVPANFTVTIRKPASTTAVPAVIKPTFMRVW